jgi:simple sugar transport system ATP-binding protein
MSTQESSLIRMVGIEKSFGRVRALRGVDFAVAHKEVVGLVGDNGAGKSTLANVLMGVYRPDKGEIFVNGAKTSFSSARDARALGIEPVYQHLALVNTMEVWRNFFLGREMEKRVGLVKMLDEANMHGISIEKLEQIGIRLRSADESILKLSGGERQSVAIARCMHFGASLMMLDEPTANLSVRESEKVLRLIKDAREKGVSSVFITHNIYAVYDVADRIVILEHGSKIADLEKKDAGIEQIIDIVRKGSV